MVENLLRVSDTNLPSWTVYYNIVSDSKWVGTGWEFFNIKEYAYDCFESHNASGNCATLRPFHKNDIPHLGAAHRM